MPGTLQHSTNGSDGDNDVDDIDGNWKGSSKGREKC